MIAFLVDHNFNEHIVDGLTRRDPTLEFTHVRDVGLAAAPDQQILEWAAAPGATGEGFGSPVSSVRDSISAIGEISG